MSTELILTAAALGVGLAMDAFSVSLANGLADKNMKAGRMTAIAGIFAGFQFLMPMVGWIFVQTAESRFEWFSALVPWIALVLLLYIGGKMLKEGVEENRRQKEAEAGDACRTDGEVPAGKAAGSVPEAEGDASEELSTGELMIQGVATSIDALSVGFTIAAYSLMQALASSLIIGVVTFAICIAGLIIGRKLGMILAGKASVLGGVILIAIGLEIWVKGIFF